MSEETPETTLDKTEIRAADFDVDAWINGGEAFTKTVQVTNKPRAGLELDELIDELDKIEKAKDARSADGGPRRTAGSRAGSAFTPAEVELKERMKALLADLDGTWVEVVLRPLDPFESNKLVDTIKNRMDRLAAALELAATIGGKPKKRDFWVRFMKAIGSGQTIKLETTLERISSASVSPDFSERVSSLLDGATSSSS